MIAVLALVSAMATRVEGTVTASPGVRVLTARAQLREGDQVKVPAKASIVVLCSTDRWVRVTGPGDWVLDAKTCDGGTPVKPGSYRELTAETGRTRFVDQGIAIEIGTRTDGQDDLVPIVLSPRNTSVADPRPAVSWTHIPQATECMVEWLDRTASRTRIPAEKAQCKAGVCTAPYPDGRAPLAAGVPAFVSVACRVGIASPWRHEKDAAEVRLLDAAAQESLRKRLDAAAAMPADADLRDVLVAGAYADSDVLHEAWRHYAGSATPAAWVSAGDLAFRMGLPGVAVREYTRASKAQPAVRAAAALGLGRVAFARRLYEEARGHFESARKAFASLHLAAEEAEARVGLEAAARMLERNTQ